MKVKSLILFLGLWLAGTAVALGQNRDQAWELGAFMGFNDFDPDLEIEDESGIGFRVGYHIRAMHEIEVSADRVDTQDDFFDFIDVEVEKFQINYLYNFVLGRGQPVVPYLTAGLGTLRIEVNEPGYGSEDETDPLFNLGAGIRFFIGHSFNIRLDLRSISFEGDRQVLNDINFDNTEFSVGLSWVVGGR